VQEFGSHFMADARPSATQPPAGDFLQSSYELWLVGHQLENGRAPWLDPYSFQPEVPQRVNFAGWPFGLPYWPVAAAFGPVVAWNLFVFLSIVAAGLLVCAWLRELEVARGAALAGGFAFALAPYRLEQSAGHVLGIVAVLLPLALWSFERGRRGSSWWFAVSGAALASIPLSGQVNLALGAVPFFAIYAVVRSRRRAALAATAAAVLASIAAGLLVQEVAIVGSIGEGGRSLDEVRVHSTHISQFVARDPPLQREQFVYLGWATLLLGALGLVALLARRRWGLAAVLTGGFLIPALLALGTNLPSYSWLWHALPPLRYPRVPERLLPIACLCLAALVGFAVAWGRSRLMLPVLVVALLFIDLRVAIFRPVSSDEANTAYAALRGRPAGRLLELPVFLPGQHFGSVYLYYDMQARLERPGGYSTLAPRDADRMARRLRPLTCGDWSVHPRAVRRLGVRYIAVHTGLYEGDVPGNRYCAPIALHALRTHGFRLIGSDNKIQMFEAQ
jgi:hypothetical protein